MSAKLAKLQSLFGEEAELDVAAMLVREPRLAVADIKLVARRLLEMRVTLLPPVRSFWSVCRLARPLCRDSRSGSLRVGKATMLKASGRNFGTVNLPGRCSLNSAQQPMQFSVVAAGQWCPEQYAADDPGAALLAAARVSTRGRPTGRVAIPLCASEGVMMPANAVRPLPGPFARVVRPLALS